MIFMLMNIILYKKNSEVNTCVSDIKNKKKEDLMLIFDIEC